MSDLTIVHYQRRPDVTNFSLERVMAEIRRSLPEGFRFKVAQCRFESKGFVRRIYNMLEAVFRQSDVNHITGDVHYLTYFLHRRKTILTILDCVSLERLSGLRKALFRLAWYTIPVRRCALVTVISRSTKQELLRHVRCDAAKIRVVPVCLFSEFVPTANTFNNRDPILLQVGATENKNIVRLASALAGIRCRLRIVGRLSPAQSAALEKHAIRFTTVASISDQELLDEYRNCDMVAFASTYEGFGIPIIEANAIGRPVVTSNILSMPEVAGSAACLVDPFDVDSIRAGILRVLEDAEYRNSLIEAGYKNAARFDAKAVAQQYAALYEEVAAGAGDPKSSKRSTHKEVVA